MAASYIPLCLNDIKRRYNLYVDPNDYKYEADIVKIFNKSLSQHKKVSVKLLDSSSISMDGKLFDDVEINATTLYYMGVYHHHVNRAKNNIDIAMQYYKLAADAGNLYAYNNLAVCYENDINDIGTAKTYYLIAVEKGLAVAMNNLGYMFYKNKDFEQSKIYYLMSIKTKQYYFAPAFGRLYDMYAEKHITFSQEDLDTFALPYKDNYNCPLLTQLIDALDCKDKRYIFKQAGLPEKICDKCELIDLKLKNITKQQECEICKEPDLICIPYDWCYHFACVNCTHILKHKKSHCPFCRR